MCGHIVRNVDELTQLRYRVDWLSDGVTVSPDAPPLTVELAGFTCTLVGGALTAVPTLPQSSVDNARSVLEPALHAWEASAELGSGLPFSFTYSGHTSIQRDQGRAGAVLVGDTLVVTDEVQVERVLGEFPPPDLTLAIEKPLAYELRLRWRAQRQGRERLTSACYAILTAAEAPAERKPGKLRYGPDRKKAAAKLNIDVEVLAKFGDLTAREDKKHGRAYDHGSTSSAPLSDAEVSWLEAVTPFLIRRITEQSDRQQGHSGDQTARDVREREDESGHQHRDELAMTVAQRRQQDTADEELLTKPHQQGPGRHDSDEPDRPV